MATHAHEHARACALVYPLVRPLARIAARLCGVAADEVHEVVLARRVPLPIGHPGDGPERVPAPAIPAAVEARVAGHGASCVSWHTHLPL